ncbi:hypothetical protein PVAND_015043 [Polypedilum vanderplanki]|uniref:Uncharacterized protein n=1 Tax=Polypedilum vanderplanki TaxID=319348 RepID=A0A9J6BBG8_POLVA|nr:hypothetical protein PVAND_015043 [Polypedilum vanderplanki]
MRERNEEEVRIGSRSPEVFEFVKCCELVVFILSTVLSFFMLYIIDNKVINILRSCVICSMSLTFIVFVEGILRNSANLIAFFAFNLYYTLCIYSIFKKFCRELYQQRLKMLNL